MEEELKGGESRLLKGSGEVTAQNSEILVLASMML